jgi:hypothetical protein
MKTIYKTIPRIQEAIIAKSRGLLEVCSLNRFLIKRRGKVSNINAMEHAARKTIAVRKIVSNDFEGYLVKLEHMQT